MSEESAQIVLLTSTQWSSGFAELAEQAELAARRQAKAVLGDRSEGLRYSLLTEQLEQDALALADRGKAKVLTSVSVGESRGPRNSWFLKAKDLPKDWREERTIATHLSKGGAAIEIRSPFAPGETRIPKSKERGPIPAAQPFGGKKEGSGPAHIQLWERQLREAAKGSDQPVVPSGLSNSTLTKGLRSYVQARAGSEPSDARVVYRDGSEGPTFPLRCLQFEKPSAKRLSNYQLLRVALISIRHPEMDPDVDFAWFRNRLVSQVRPAAETDVLAYKHSREKLEYITSKKPLHLEMFQTGLEPAVIGFYRAVTAHLQDKPGSLIVTPQHYHRRTDAYYGSEPWAVKA